MAIPESLLTTWANAPSTQQFTDTYATIKNVLDYKDAPYLARTKVDVFLQGSYRNATNVYGDSDVDIVVCQTSSFLYSLDQLGPAGKNAFSAAFPGNAAYGFANFKVDVTTWLQKQYPGALDTSPKKAMFLKGNGSSRRDADILVCSEYHDYYNFPDGASEGGFYPGVKFYTTEGVPIVNYPKLHIKRCEDKNQNTDGNFKATVRIYKNMRKRLIDVGLLADGVAPSYYIEGMLYNVDDDVFTGTYQSMVLGSYRWMRAADQSKLWCANGMRPLLLNERLDSWAPKNCETFLDAIAYQWDNWGD